MGCLYAYKRKLTKRIARQLNVKQQFIFAEQKKIKITIITIILFTIFKLISICDIIVDTESSKKAEKKYI